MTIDILVIGGLNWDHFALGPQLPGPGETVRGSRYLQAPGGKGANIAVTAARLGRTVALVGRIGEDPEGEAVQRAVGAAGVDLSLVRAVRGAATGTAVIQVGERGEKRIIAVPGANLRLEVADIRAACEQHAAARVAVLSLECGLEAVRVACAVLAPAGCAILLDPSPAEGPLPADVLRHVRLVKPDANEAEQLTGIVPRDRDAARKAAQRLLDQGVGAAVVQAGDGGDLLVEAGGEYWFPRFNVHGVDATGAGDAYLGTIAARLAVGSDLPSAVRAGSAGAALATRALGAQTSLAYPAELERLLAPAARAS